MSLIDRFKMKTNKGIGFNVTLRTITCENEHIKIKDTHSLPDGYSGFYKDGIILIDKDLSETRKVGVRRTGTS